MRYVCPGLLVALSFLSPCAFAATGPALSIANYHLLGGVRQTRTVTLFTYSADLVNAGQAQPSITATVTSSVASIVVQPGQGSLHFPPAPANSTVTSTDFFTVLVDRTGDDDFSNLTWQFSAPVANAGPNQTVVAGATVTLNASGSTNPSGIGTLAYAWAFAAANGRPKGSAAVIQNPGSVMPTFVADVTGNYNIVLTVSNGAGVDSSAVIVTTTNSPPVANAGPNQSLSVGSTVVLNGSASHDVDGDPLTYSWTLVLVPSGSLATLSGPTTVSPTFVADKVGMYKAQLLVNDGFVNSAPSQVTISSNETPPVANAGVSQAVAAGALVQLDGSKSTDVDGNALTYRWSINSLPTGSMAVLSSTTIMNPTFTADVAGSYVVQLIVNDGFDDSPPSTVTISTNAVLAPTANAGPNQTVAHGSTVTLSGSGTDPQGLTLTYHWSVTSKPAGSSATLSDVSIAGPSFVADLPGSYVLQLIVNNGALNSNPSTVTITTTNTPPVANAGPNQIVAVGSIVTLNGSASYDADNDPITYSWSLQSVPPGSTATLLATSIVSPTFVADLPGAYVAQLIVKDPFTSGTPATVTIVATSPSGITLTPNPLNLSLNSSGSLTVTIGSTAGSSGQIINLAALDSTIATLPPTVTIPAGSKSATVTVAPAGNTGATQINASALGFQPGFDTVNVTQPNITLTLSNSAVGITKTVTGTVTLSASVPPGGITVNLSAVPVGIVSFPASISIPSGNTGTFTVTGSSSGTTTITAGSPGYVSSSATVTAAALGAIALPSGTVVAAGQTQPFGVTLISAAPAGGVTVTLLSADTSKFTVSPSVFIAAGATTPAVSAQVSGVGIGSAGITASAAGFTGASTNVTVVAPLAVTPTSLPNGMVGVLYPAATVSASGGTPPYVLSSANLPAGLSFNTFTGVLSGTPTAAGTGSITVKDSSITPLTQTLSVTVNITPLVITPASFSNGTVGVLYPTTTVSASGGTAPYIMTAANLPTGLSFNAATGVLSGTPTAAGTGTITVRDSAGTPQTGTLSVTVYPSLAIAPASLSAGVEGSVYPTTTFTASGGIPPYVFSAANLPTGLSFDPIAGVLSGTPSATGTGTISVHDSTSPVSMTASVSLTINPVPLVITTTSLVNGTVGVIYSATVAASGGTPPYTFTATGLPGGLSMRSNGQITGIPSAAGTSQVVVTVTDSSSSSVSASVRRASNVGRRSSATLADSASSPATATATIPLTINPQPLVVSTSSLASGTVGVSYSQTLGATGGTQPYVWSIISGSLPSGLTLNPAGEIVGVPDGTGSLSTTVVLGVKDSGTPQQSAQSGILSVTISAAVLPPYLTVTGVTVGHNLQTNIAVTLNNFVGSTNVTVSSDNSNVLLAKVPGTVGSQSITIVGATTSFFLYVQGFANSGIANITAHATALGAVDGTAVVTMAPSAFVLSGPNGVGASVLSNEGVTVSMSVIATQLDSSGNPAQTQQLAAGLTQVVTLGNTNSAVGVVPASVTFTAGTDTVTFNFVGGTTAGSTIVTVNEPTGFTTPSQNANVIAVTVQATQLTPSNVTVGKNLEATAQVVLSTGVASDLVVTLTSSDSTKVLLSTDPTLPGTSTITMTVKAPSNHTQVFYVYGLASSGTSGYTATATGFSTTTGLVTLAPSGFVLEGPSGIGQDFFAVTGGYPTSVNVDSAILDGSGNYVQEQALAGGQTVNVAVTSSLSSVGTVGSPVTITGGNYTATTQFTALGPGTTLLSAVAPSGFSTSQYSSLHATVNNPNILIDTGNSIGMNLELQGTIFLGASAPSSGASVVLTVTAGQVLLSPTATGSGSTSITVAIPAGQFIGTYYMYGQDTTGSATITATSAGYNPGSGVENLTPSGVVVYGPNGVGYPLSASVSAGNTTVNVSTAQLDASDNFVQTQPLAPTSDGVPLQAFLNSTVTTVGTFTSPAIILVGSATATVQFTPLQTGSMVISVPTPPGFTTPAADATLSVTVGN